jgi:hypothetical protein
MAGAILATSNIQFKVSEILKKLLPYLAFAMLVAAFFTYSSELAYPGVYALLPVLATVLLIYSLRDSTSYVYKILTLKPVLFTGRISYSLYMWHYPICILASSLYLAAVPVVVKLSLLASVYLLSVLSYYCIELPFRTGFIKPKIAVTIIILSWVGVYATIKLSDDNKNGKFGKENYRFVAEEDRKQAFLTKHEVAPISSASSNYLKVYKIGSEDSTPDMVLYGDSHAAALVPGLDSIAKQNKKALYVITQPGYPPIYGVYREAFDDSIINAHKLVLQFMQDHKELKTVIIAARWSCYSGGLIMISNKLKIGNDTSRKTYSQDSLLALGVANMIDTINNMGKSVAITTSVPEIRCMVYKMIMINKIRKIPYADFAYSHEEYLNLNKFFLRFLSQLKAEKRAVVIDIAKPLLDNNRYKVVSDNKLLYSDDNHLSPFGSVMAASAFEPLFKNIE